MAQPVAYAPATSFVGYQAQQPWFPGQNIDLELNALKSTTDQVRANLALIQRDDGALANGVVTFAALSPTLQTAGLAPLSAWATGTAFTVPQAILFGSALYQCAIAHTSGVFATDLAAGKWTLLANLSILSGATSVSANAVAAGPTSGPAATPTFRLLVGSDLPLPSASTLGGVQSLAVVGSRWINTISTSGVPAATQPAFSDISGTVAAAQLPNPSASTLGGVQSLAVVASNWINTISTSGVPSATQPAFTDISGSVAATQLPNPSATTLGGVKSLAVVASKWINTISTAGAPAATQPAFTDLTGSVAAGQMPALTGDVTTSAGAVATTIAANAVTNAKAAQMAAFTLKGNATGSPANATDISIPALTQKASPVAADKVMIADSAASDALKFATVSSIASAGSVSSIAGNTGAFTLGAGLTNATNVLLVDAAYMRGYISGLTLANDGGTPNSVFDIAAGVATSDDNTTLMKLASAYTKSNGAWVVGTGNGGIDTGSVGASTWYHVFLIERTDTGVVDVLFSTSPTSPTMPTNYTKKRRIGSIRTNGAGSFLAFTQVSNQFTWAAPVLDFNTTITTARSTITLTVPTGVVVSASVVGAGGSAGSSVVWVGPLTVTDGAPSLTASPPGFLFYQNVAGATSSSGGVTMMTNTSAQVGARADTAATTLRIMTNGWTDFL